MQIIHSDRFKIDYYTEVHPKFFYLPLSHRHAKWYITETQYYYGIFDNIKQNMFNITTTSFACNTVFTVVTNEMAKWGYY